MNADHHKHDRFIKAVFANVEKARTYFEDNLPAELLEQLDRKKQVGNFPPSAS